MAFAEFSPYSMCDSLLDVYVSGGCVFIFSIDRKARGFTERGSGGSPGEIVGPAPSSRPVAFIILPCFLLVV